MRPRRPPSVPALALLCACGAGQSEASGFGTPSHTTAPASSTANSTASSSGGSTSTGGHDSTTISTTSTGGGDSGPILDMAVPDFGQQHPIGCKGKIDFLFSISASGNMSLHQEQLVASLPGFMATIEEQLPDFDVHVIVADVDKGWTMDDCSLCTTSCNPQGVPPLCGAALHPCDKTQGAGVTFPAGKGASNRRCELASGKRYITAGEPDLGEAFACIAQVGLEGGFNTMDAALTGLSPEFNGPGGCNEGFLRDDALLVVTIINDSYDSWSKGWVELWIEALRDAKHGDDDAFAVLVLTTDVDLGLGQLCHPDSQGPPNPLRELVEGVNHGFIGSICSKTFEPFFAETVAEIVSLCDGFVIPQ